MIYLNFLYTMQFSKYLNSFYGFKLWFLYHDPIFTIIPYAGITFDIFAKN